LASTAGWYLCTCERATKKPLPQLPAVPTLHAGCALSSQSKNLRLIRTRIKTFTYLSLRLLTRLTPTSHTHFMSVSAIGQHLFRFFENFPHVYLTPLRHPRFAPYRQSTTPQPKAPIEHLANPSASTEKAYTPPPAYPSARSPEFAGCGGHGSMKMAK